MRFLVYDQQKLGFDLRVGMSPAEIGPFIHQKWVP